MLKMQDQAISAHPVSFVTPVSPVTEDWDAMMRALRQRIIAIADTPPAALSWAQRRDSLSDCRLALAQLSANLGRFNATPAAQQQREHQLKQSMHLLACAWRAGEDSTSDG